MDDELSFLHVAYIRASAEEVWQALTHPELTQDYWFGTRVEGDWRVGGQVTLNAPGLGVTDRGQVLVCEAPCRLAYSWNVLFDPIFAREGASRVSFDLKRLGAVTMLTIVHDGFKPGSKVFESIRDGWPLIASSLKSFLENGAALEITQASEAVRAHTEAAARARQA